MIRTTTFVLLGLLAAVAGAFVPSAGPSFGKSLLRVSEFVGSVIAVVLRHVAFAHLCMWHVLPRAPYLFPHLLILSPSFHFHLLPREILSCVAGSDGG